MRQSKFSELVTKVVLTDFEDQASIVTEVKSWLNEGLIRIGREDLRCFETKIEFNTTIGKYDYDLEMYLPEFRKMIDICSANGPIDFQDVKRVDYRLFATPTTDLTPGTPDIAYIFEGKLYLYPVANEIINIAGRYYFIPTEMTDDDEYCPIPRERDYILVKYAKAMYDFREKDLDSYRQRMAEFEAELSRWVVEDFEICEDTTDLFTLERQYKEDWRRK